MWLNTSFLSVSRKNIIYTWLLQYLNEILFLVYLFADILNGHADELSVVDSFCDS